MGRRNKVIVLCLLGVLGLAFTSIFHFPREEPVPIPASPQRVGNAATGYRYLITGDYLKSGIPYGYFLLGFGKSPANLLKRDSPNVLISHEYTAVKSPNGETVVAPNCMQCHAQVFDGKLYIGLGNSMIDFTDRQKLNPRTAQMAQTILQRGDPKKYDAALPFLRAMRTISGDLYTQVRGVNS